MAPREDALHPGYTIASHVEETIVRFDPAVTDELIESYVNARPPTPSTPPPPSYPTINS